MEFLLDGEILYKKGRDLMLLICVDANKAKRILKEIHEGVYGTHTSGHMMTQQIMRARYYWMIMENGCINYARKFHKCQIYANKVQIPPSPYMCYSQLGLSLCGKWI